jgi:HK97 family phage portal protein
MALRNWLRAPIRRLASWAKRGISIGDEAVAALFGYSRKSSSGIAVTDRTALESVEYFAGVRNISEDLATLPLIVYQRTGERSRKRDPEHPLYPILHDQPNEEQDAVEFIEMMQAWLMLRRNAYAEIQRTNGGIVVGLWPIPPSQVTVSRIQGELVYRINLPLGEKDPVTGLPYSLLPKWKVFHLKAFALDGVLGENPITLHKDAIGLSLALDHYGAEFFANDATPGGVYEVPGTLSDVAYERMKKELDEPHQGLGNRHRTKLLEQGTKYNPISVENDKAQFIESKRHSTEQMARINRIAPHKIGDLSRATFSNIEHQGIDYVVSSIRVPAVRWERGILTQLIAKSERRTHYAEFLIDALLRADAQSRAEALAIERQNGVINADEWRALNNMNEIEDGSGKPYLVNGNMIPALEAGKPRTMKLDQEGRVASLEIHQPPAAFEAAGRDPARVFAPLFRAAAESCLGKESAAVGKAIDRLFRAKGVQGLEAWAVEFYGQHEASVVRTFAPLASSVGEAVRGPEGADLAGWAADYARSVAAARRKAGTEELRAVLTSASSGMEERLKAAAQGWTKPEAVTAMAEREAVAMVESLKRYLAREPGLAA